MSGMGNSGGERADHDDVYRSHMAPDENVKVSSLSIGGSAGTADRERA